MANPSGSTGQCPACMVENVALKDVGGGVLVCERCASKSFSTKVRKHIQEAFDRQQARKRKEAWVKRMEVAKKAVKLYETKKLPEALQLFREYVAILEYRHNVPAGGLRSDLFDARKETAELILCSGVYWDMAKIYDKMKGQTENLRACLNKYVEFSIDRPHLVLASEAVRKHITTGNPINKEEFKNAHAVLRKHLAKCFIASAIFGPLSNEVTIFRNFRDTVLMSFLVGRLFVNCYYKLSPTLAMLLLRFSILSFPFKIILRKLAQLLNKRFNY